MIDTEAIKKSLTNDNIITLLDSFDCPVVKVGENELIFYSICHHKDDCRSHKPKLYYWKEIRSFKCWSCGWTGDVFALVRKLLDCGFRESVDYVCRICGIMASEIGKESIDDWKYIKRFLPMAADEVEPLPIYDGEILRGLSKLYPDDWIKSGITKDIMDKFGIAWYDRAAAITIPIVDSSGNLCGIRARFTREHDISNGKYRPLSTLDKTYKFPTSSVCYGLWQGKEAIADSHRCHIFEGEKSVLRAWSWGIQDCIAVFGHNISRKQIQDLLNVGCTEVVICFDSDFHKRGDEEYKLFVATINKTIKRLRPYFAKISVCWNNCGYDGYKFSPVDFTYTQFQELYKRRTIV